MQNKIITSFFISLILFAVVLSVALPDEQYSEAEKRALAQADSVKISDYFSGEFQTNLDKYLSDQFPARDSWITIKTFGDLVSGKREISGVYLADDMLIQRFSGMKNLVSNAEGLLKLQEQLKSQNISFSAVMIPTAACIYSDKLPLFAPNPDQSQITKYLHKQGLNVIDVESALNSHKNEYIYYRTDHHYTSLGAYYCYAEYRKAINKSVRGLSDYTAEKLCDDFLGTSYNKVNFPFVKADEVTAYYICKNRAVSYNFGNYKADEIYERKFLATKDQYAVFLNSNQAQTVIEGSGEGKLLIVKDSFGNTFAQFPCEDYAEIHIIDLRFFRGSIAEYSEENGIDEVCAVFGLQNFSNDIKLIII